MTSCIYKKYPYHPFDSVSSKFPTHASAQEWAKSTIKINWIIIKRKPPNIPKYIQVDPNDFSGIKKAPMIPPIIKRYLIAQNLRILYKYHKSSDFNQQDENYLNYPFCIGARGSCELFTLIIITDIKKKYKERIKHIL